MKKLIYIILVSITTSICLSACTEEEIKPNTVLSSQGKEQDPLR
jgi:hypothetical protein